MNTYSAWLIVKYYVFSQIKVCFLMVGHTHEDIDQMFSCISRRLSKNNARTLLELIREIGMSCSLFLHFSYSYMM